MRSRGFVDAHRGRPHLEAVLAVDVGNTNTVLGVFRRGRLGEYWRIASRPSATGDDLLTVLEPLLRKDLADLASSRSVVVGSVVPALTREYEAAMKRLLGAVPLVADYRLRLGIRLDVVDPSSVGPDRIANAVAAVERGRLPAIVVDLGTATTFDVVDAKGRYLGGAIAPGVAVSTENLFRSAARLSKVEFKKPERFIGRTTEESLQSGLFYGAAGQIDAVVRGIRKELGGKAYVVATGGLASLLAEGSKTIQSVDPALTLKGFYRIFLLNA